MVRYQGRYQKNLLLRNSKTLVLIAIFLLFMLYISASNYQSRSKPIDTKNNPDPRILSPSSYGYKNFTEFIPGHLPLILLIPHGGHLFPGEIPDRKQSVPGTVKSNDINTQEIGHLLSNGIMQMLDGRRPYIVINHLGRSKIDVNRPLKDGAEFDSNNETLIVWNDYHSFIKHAISEIDLRFGCGLLIDVHGHGHQEGYIELGYTLSTATLSLFTLDDDNEIASKSSIRALYTRKKNVLNFSELLRGEYTSLGGKLQSLGYDTIPSHIHKFPKPDERYFQGGYSVQRYGSRNNEHVIDAIQIELPRFIRLAKRKSQKKFISKLAEALVWYIQEYYLPEDSPIFPKSIN